MVNDEGIRKTVRVHRIVAYAFLGHPLLKKQVNHKDGIKDNPHVNNLEWVSQSENQLHAYKNGLNYAPRKSFKYNDKTIYKICEMLQEGYLVSKISKELNIPKSTIKNIKYRRSLKEYSENYKF